MSFQFKQFTILQEQATLKVSTDSCLLGAWFAQKLENKQHILDIGSGTGLLVLMLAQKQTESNIDGIEIDENCFVESLENIKTSPWANRCNVLTGDARTYLFPRQYDFIITNPPFYEQQLESVDKKNNLAKHSSHLGLKELVAIIKTQLLPHGEFGILLPYSRLAEIEEISSLNGFYLKEKILVKQTTNHPYFRVILHFIRDHSNYATETIIIKENNEYTPAFIELLKDYYLKLPD
ncbi:MAG: methyltransferase [Chitinophagaceae bacterium]|nr:methyltransferase [Chitinophagaceae bacterium]